MAAERVRRANAGKNIGKLIDRELGGDTFYTTAYGGFEEESGDEEYEVRRWLANSQKLHFLIKAHCNFMIGP